MTEAHSSGRTTEAKQAPEPALLIPSTFTLGDALAKAGLPLAETMVIRHAYVKVHKDGFPGINADSTFDQIMTYTSTQSRDTKVLQEGSSTLLGRLSPRTRNERASVGRRREPRRDRERRALREFDSG